MMLQDIYDAGYRDGEYDGYNSTIIENGVEESHYDKGFEFDKMTNGDVIKTMFPDVEVKEKNNGYEVYFGVGTTIQFFNHQWWNAPYETEREIESEE